MLIVFRTDADPAIGGGHAMRCLTLALEMRHRGADVVFLCKVGTTETVPALARSRIVCLAADRHDWNDAIAAGKLDGKQVDLIVVDSYSLGESFERSLRSHSCPIMVVDDAPSRRHDCDLLVDMTPSRVAADYAGLIPPHCRVLAGSSYALLRSDFGELRSSSLSRRQASPRLSTVFISLGMTDIGGQTGPIARSLADDIRLERIIVVTGATAPSRHDIISLQYEAPKISVCVDPPNIAELMSGADIAIAAPGTSSWERCCLGLPSILLVLADNQIENARLLEQAGAARLLPPHIEPSSLAFILHEIADTPGLLGQMSRRAADICDGNGAFRVGSAIDELVLPKGASELALRRATVEDSARLWLWRNEYTARAMSTDQRPVPWEAHVAWLTARLADDNTMIFIVEIDGRPCGSIRFESELTGSAWVSIALARHVRGLGRGAAALALACQDVFKQQFCDCIEARVKRGNFASQRLFLTSGFVPIREEAEYYVYQFVRKTDAEPDNGIAARP
jgi:UDP-2,4-diacetamido-2,4,6-trideoxy-beta-L-altropyranose hydrolase